MKSLNAYVTSILQGDCREEPRWRVDLFVDLPRDHVHHHARVRNLSEGGMMLETDAEMTVGDVLSVELAGSRRIDARIVWRQKQALGCQFLTPIPTSVVKAAIRRTPVKLPANAIAEPQFEEIPIGLHPTMDELAEWNDMFARKHAARGLRLLAYRQTEGGLLIAIAGHVRQ